LKVDEWRLVRRAVWALNRYIASTFVTPETRGIAKEIFERLSANKLFSMGRAREIGERWGRGYETVRAVVSRLREDGWLRVDRKATALGVRGNGGGMDGRSVGRPPTVYRISYAAYNRTREQAYRERLIYEACTGGRLKDIDRALDRIMEEEAEWEAEDFLEDDDEDGFYELEGSM
jgi:hypothetical protein